MLSRWYLPRFSRAHFFATLLANSSPGVSIRHAASVPCNTRTDRRSVHVLCIPAASSDLSVITLASQTFLLHAGHFSAIPSVYSRSPLSTLYSALFPPSLRRAFPDPPFRFQYTACSALPVFYGFGMPYSHLSLSWRLFRLHLSACFGGFSGACPLRLRGQVFMSGCDLLAIACARLITEFCLIGVYILLRSLPHSPRPVSVVSYSQVFPGRASVQWSSVLFLGSHWSGMSRGSLWPHAPSFCTVRLP